MEKTEGELSLWRTNGQVRKGRTEAERTQEPAPRSVRWAAWGQEVSDEDGNLDWRHVTGGQRAFTGFGLDFVSMKDPLKSLSWAMSWPLMCYSRKGILVAAYSHNLQNRKLKAGDDLMWWEECNEWGFPGGSGGKDSAYIPGDSGSIPRPGRSPGGENGNLLQSQHERGESKKALSGREDTYIVNFFFFRDKEGASKLRGTREENEWDAQSPSFLYDRKDRLQSEDSGTCSEVEKMKAWDRLTGKGLLNAWKLSYSVHPSQFPIQETCGLQVFYFD